MTTTVWAGPEELPTGPRGPGSAVAGVGGHHRVLRIDAEGARVVERDGGRRVDDVDRALLALLSADPRASARKLSREIGMSPGAVGERLERLQEHGVIRGFSLDVDPSALGFGLEVMVAIELRQGSPVENTIDLLWGIEEVQAIQLVTGRWDLVLSLLVRDQHHLREVLLGAVWSVADFQHSETMIILDRRQRVAIGRPATGEGSVEE